MFISGVASVNVTCLFWLPPWLGSLQNKYNYTIFNTNLAITTWTYKQMYQTKAITTQATLQTSLSNNTSVITPPSCYPPLLHLLGELVSRRGVALWVQSLWDIDMNVLDCHKKSQTNNVIIDWTQFDIENLYLTRVAWNLLKFVLIPELARTEVVSAASTMLVALQLEIYTVSTTLQLKIPTASAALSFPVPTMRVESTVKATRIHLEVPTGRRPYSWSSSQHWARRRWHVCLRSHRRHCKSWRWHRRTL
jgi:hypothetical protein